MKDGFFYPLLILIMGALLTATFGIGYYWGSMNCPEPELVEIETLCYSLDPGTDGIIKYRKSDEGLIYVTFVQQGDTFALDALNEDELDSLVNELYPSMK